MGNDVSRLVEEERGSHSISLEQKKLAEIPAQISLLSNDLQRYLINAKCRLRLENNLLNKLPAEMAQLSQLKYLNLRANLFREFPAVLCKLANLEILDISRNKIPNLPADFGSLMQLRVLSIAKNRIKVLNSYIAEMPQLKILKMHHNPFSFPPREITEQGDMDMDTWLQGLQEYLRQHPMPKGEDEGSDTSVEEHQWQRNDSVDSVAARLAPPSLNSRSRNSSADMRFDHLRGTSFDSVSSFDRGEVESDRVAIAYFQQPVRRDGGHVDACRGVIFSLAFLYRAVRLVVSSCSDTQLVKQLQPQCQTANDACLHCFSILSRGSQRLGDLQEACKKAVNDYCILAGTIKSHVRALAMSSDQRAIRHLWLALQGATIEMRLFSQGGFESEIPTLQDPTALLAMPRPRSRSRRLEGSPRLEGLRIRRPLELETKTLDMRRPFDFNEKKSDDSRRIVPAWANTPPLSPAVSVAERAAAAAARAVEVLKRESGEELQKAVKRVVEEQQRMEAGDATGFVKAVVKMLSEAKALAQSGRLSRNSSLAIQRLTSVTKELAQSLQ